MKKELVRALAKGFGIYWSDRICLHAAQGTVSNLKICIHNFECWHCAFDQWIEEVSAGKKIKGEAT